jgi:hypothetical protein
LTEIYLSTIIDEDTSNKYFSTFSKPFGTNKTKLEKSSHLTIELVVSLIVNNEEHLPRALTDTGATRSINLLKLKWL